MIYYPLTLGRNFDEIKRVLIALQTTDAFNVAIPANWIPGDDVILPTPTTCKGVQERIESAKETDINCIDWFLCTKKLSSDAIYKKIEVK